MSNILVTGASGQIGSELVPALAALGSTVFSFDIKAPSAADPHFIQGDILDNALLEKIIVDNHISEIYHLVSLLSATGEKNPELAWKINMGSLKNILDLCVKYKIKLFWPSSIAAFGPTTPRVNTPQHTILEPTTMYGVTKVAGELLCQYYWKKFSLDVRSVRYPGLISYKAEPGGGTTDFAVAIFYEALKSGAYTCFVRPDTTLPMMYMDDAIRGTIELMSAPAKELSIHTSYNLASLSFSAEELAAQINKVQPVKVSYEPDFRQAIADSWPQSIDDSAARTDWNWHPQIDLPKMVEIMLSGLKSTLK